MGYFYYMSWLVSHITFISHALHKISLHQINEILGSCNGIVICFDKII